MIVWLQLEGRLRKIELGSVPPLRSGSTTDGGDAFVCVVDGRAITADVRLLKPGVLSLILDGQQFRCVLDGNVLINASNVEKNAGTAVIVDGRRCEFEVADPRSLQSHQGVSAGTSGTRVVKAPMPGRIIRVLVSVGESVDAQQGLLVIEAMKMQNELKSPKTGTVVRVAVGVGDTVQAGGVLVIVE